MPKNSAPNLNFSFCPELPKCNEPRNCCNLMKLTSVYFITTLIIFSISLTLLALSFIDLTLIRETHFPLLVLVFFASFLMLTLSSSYGVVSSNHYFIVPQLVFMILVIISVSSFCIIVFVLHRKDENIWIFLSVFGAIILFDFYYTYIVLSLFKYVKSKRETDQFVRNQNMFDDVCREMLEEDHQLAMRNMEAYVVENEYYESFCSSEDSSHYTINPSTFHRSFHQRVTFYDPDEKSF